MTSAVTPEPEEARSARQRLRRSRTAIPRVGAAPTDVAIRPTVSKIARAVGSSGAAVIAVFASALALAFSLWPSLSPDPRTVLAASIKVQTLEPGVTYRDFLQRVGEDLGQVRPSVLRARGYFVYLQIRIEGRKHGSLRVNKLYYAAATGRRIPGQTRPQDSSAEAGTPNDQWIHPVFVLKSPYEYPVFVRLELFDDDTLLAYADTPTLPPRRART